MAIEPAYIQYPLENEFTFSVCSLVRDVERYNTLLETFEKYGFNSENTQFLAADNRTENQFDGYSWIKRMLPECKGKYVLFCHEDLVLIDHGFDDLVATLDDLEERDPSWLLAGIAGGEWRPGDNSKRQQKLRISDKYGNDRRYGELPARVESLDECFILMKRDKPVVNSYNLEGFHFYGPDICMVAEMLGGKAYAIDFHLRHEGEAKRGPTFRQSRRAFSEKYRKFFPGRVIHCTTGAYPLGGGWADIQ